MPPDWAKAWAPVLQAVSSSTLTLAAVCVAFASLVFAYQNYFGWKPVAFIMNFGIFAYLNRIDISFEIWNRRKYPISVRRMELSMPDVEITEDQLKSGRKITADQFQSDFIPHHSSWERNSDDAFVNNEMYVIGPSEHVSYEIQMTAETPAIKNIEHDFPPFTIKITYLDLRKKKVKKLVMKLPRTVFA